VPPLRIPISARPETYHTLLPHCRRRTYPAKTALLSTSKGCRRAVCTIPKAVKCILPTELLEKEERGSAKSG
jgi:hypothetical protein